jgi:hypothetical protein
MLSPSFYKNELYSAIQIAASASGNCPIDLWKIPASKQVK